jgi:hypothetical protein
MRKGSEKEISTRVLNIIRKTEYKSSAHKRDVFLMSASHDELPGVLSSSAVSQSPHRQPSEARLDDQEAAIVGQRRLRAR